MKTRHFAEMLQRAASNTLSECKRFRLQTLFRTALTMLQLGIDSVPKQLESILDSSGQPEESMTPFYRAHVWGSLLANLPSDQKQCLDSTEFVLMPLRSIDAFTSRSESGQTCVALNSGLSGMIHYFVESVATFAINASRPPSDEDFAALERSLSFVMQYYADPDIAYPLQDDRNMEMLLYCGAATFAAEAYVVAHEIAHLVQDSPAWPVQRPAGEHRVRGAASGADSHQWEREFEADAFAYFLYLQSSDTIPLLSFFQNGTAPASSDFFVHTAPYVIFELLAFIRANGELHQNDASHPSSLERLERLVQLASRDLDDERFMDATRHHLAFALCPPRLGKLKEATWVW